VGPDSGIWPISPNGFLKDLRLGGCQVATDPEAIAFKNHIEKGTFYFSRKVG
jgi:hypothetical protein